MSRSRLLWACRQRVSFSWQNQRGAAKNPIFWQWLDPTQDALHSLLGTAGPFLEGALALSQKRFATLVRSKPNPRRFVACGLRGLRIRVCGLQVARSCDAPAEGFDPQFEHILIMDLEDLRSNVASKKVS